MTTTTSCSRGRWTSRSSTPSRRGSAERRAIIEPIAELVAGSPPQIRPDAARAALAPALWLLELGADGIALTQTGAVNRALVREAAQRWQGWWNAEIHGEPHRETDVALLHELHWLLRRLRLLRRTGRRLVTTAAVELLLIHGAAARDRDGPAFR